MADIFFNFSLCAQIVAALFFLALYSRGGHDKLFLYYCLSALVWCAYKLSQGHLFFILAWLNTLLLVFCTITKLKPGFILAHTLGISVLVLLLSIALTYPSNVKLWAPFTWLIDSVYLLAAWLLLRRFSATLNQLEFLNDELKRRVANAKTNIEQQHQQLAQRKLNRLLDNERSRIHRDLHDEIGASLLSLVHSARSQEDANLARFALQDLRDTVALNNRNSHNLADILASICTETMHSCDNAEIDLDWQQPELEHITLCLSQTDALQLKRLLRELVGLILEFDVGEFSVYWRLQNQQLLLSLNWQALAKINGLAAALEQCLTEQARLANHDISYPLTMEQSHG